MPVRNFFFHFFEALKVQTGNEALQLFYHSDKIKNDLETALKYPKLWDVEIIVREFNQNVQLENEYRGFVYENQLNALSQYDIKVNFQSFIFLVLLSFCH
jgi:hypothetical protein